MIKPHSSTNPSLRKLYREAYKVSKNASIDSIVMCPCGCLKTFKKCSDSQIFNPENKKCKDRFHNRIRSRSNYAFTQKMLEIRHVMTIYLLNNQIKNKETIKTPVKKETLTFVTDDFSPENFINVMKQTKIASKNANAGQRVMCSCGCMKTFVKSTSHHTFCRDEGEACKDKYYSITRGNEKIEITPEIEFKFKIMKNYVNDSISAEISKNKVKSKRNKIR